MKLLKSLTTVTLLTAFTVSLPTATIHAAASINFKDIRGHWAETDVQIAVKKAMSTDMQMKPLNRSKM